MRVLWVVNLILPVFAKMKGKPFSGNEGWLSGIYQAVGAAGLSDLTLAVAYPEDADTVISGKENWNGTVWYAFAEELGHPERYDAALEERFREILADFQPDLVHVFGTEFPHGLAVLKVWNRPDRTLVGIQGFCAGIADAYMAGLPEDVQREVTFRDLIRKDSLMQQQKKFRARAEHEREALMLAGHVTGRTDYDRRVTGEVNPARVYHPMNETLRDVFYEGRWTQKEAVRFRVFLPQGNYPLKGFHYLLEALRLLLPDYPEIQLVVAGNSVIGGDGRRIPMFLRIGAYGRYLRRLIAQGHLKNHVTVTGRLTAEQMKEHMLRSSVFVLPSEIENSPNSMGEAMLLGMPVIASRTGGIPSLLTENREGLLVDPGDTKGLAQAIRQIFEEPVIAGVYGENAAKRARVTHDPKTNFERLLAIYGEIMEGGGDAAS
ncbi:MAG: glycosyltransferase family 4 protein [Lachnospiraceae bacterium]|nr:glycosyltransferase family 4 protein [Lachnospiraceae bacterium]